MSLYQTSVLKNYINLQNKETVTKAYKKYSKYFLNPTIQDNIRSSKEEEYQGIFLTELFVNILGYTLKPNANFNLVAEYKNQTNARKADGAILNNEVAVGVIELKGTNTKDLESIRKQAFDYKANQKGCTYVITSNFEKLRFYINDATEFEEFNLFELSPARFALLYLCLQKDQIINNVPLKIKEASVVEEEQITKQFYKDYSLFKRELYRDLVKRNAKNLKQEATLQSAQQNQTLSEQEITEQQQLEKNVKLTLFKKSQKLIDRYLFIFFAEDRGLLPPNSTQQIVDKWKDDVDFGDDRPLYVLFKQYFTFLDQGRAGTTKRAEIYAYNGGLFKEDKILDRLEIDSDLLYNHTSKLAAYDFESQVDVNILGHIFENSLNEIESVNAEIEGADFDKQKSKRKKDGVFYTPKYITKYIVENTVGKLCTEKKNELGFKEEEYFKGRKNRNKNTITNLVNVLDTYREWLLQLTICDPACGSGAFLNQALDFLIKEHSYIDELKAKILGGGIVFSDIETTILENNIYGVDLNEESVEIAKLSLWLRTAQPRRKLNDLSSNIKCGNSLISSKAVAGDKAFNWEAEFPQVFNPQPSTPQTPLRGGTTKQPQQASPEGTPQPTLQEGIPQPSLREGTTKQPQQASPEDTPQPTLQEGTPQPSLRGGTTKQPQPQPHQKNGFDVIIGNPPYVSHDRVENKKYISKNYEVHQGFADLFCYFYELGIRILKEFGYLSFITSNSFLKAEYGSPLRKHIIQSSSIYEIINIEDAQVFSDAIVNSSILSLKKTNIKNDNCLIVNKKYSLEEDFLSYIELNKFYYKQNDFDSLPWNLIRPEVLKLRNKIKAKNPTLEKLETKIRLGIATGSNEAFVISSEKRSNLIAEDSKSADIIKPILRGKDIERYYYNSPDLYLILSKNGVDVTNDYKAVYKHLNSFGDKFKKRGAKGKHWTNLRACSFFEDFKKDKIVWIELTDEGRFSSSKEEIYLLNSAYFLLPPKDLNTGYLLCLLNSKLIKFYLKQIANTSGVGTSRWINIYVKEFPIVLVDKKKQNELDNLEKNISLNLINFNNFNIKLQKYLTSQFELQKLSKKLQNWHELDFGNFIKELNKAVKANNKLREKEGLTPVAPLTKKDEFEWLDLFEDNKQKAQALQAQIQQTDAAIDAMVYQLYGLTDEEIAIVESA